MIFEKGKELEAKIIKIENFGLFLDLGIEKKGFLSKDSIFLSKNKKLKDVFLEGYIIKAKLVGEKKEYYTLTQKEITFAKQKEKLPKNENKTQKNSRKKVKTIKKIASFSVKQPSQETNEEDFANQKTTLEDLKKLKKIGNLKISTQKKKIKKTEKKTLEIKEKEEIILEAPKNFIENMEEKIKYLDKDLLEIKNNLQKGGFLDEN